MSDAACETIQGDVLSLAIAPVDTYRGWRAIRVTHLIDNKMPFRLITVVIANTGSDAHQSFGLCVEPLLSLHLEDRLAAQGSNPLHCPSDECRYD